MMKDVTEEACQEQAHRKQLEEALKQAEQKYRSIFENAIDGIFQTTPDGRFITANPALARMYGYESPEELVASLADIERQLYVHPNRRAEFMRLMEKYSFVKGFESQVYCKDGKVIWVSENVRAVRDKRGALLYYEGIVKDITEHKQLEAEFLQAQKMESLGRLAGGVAHDFNNLLTVIMGSIDLVIQDLPSPPEVSDLLDIKEVIKRAASLSHQLLTFARQQIIEPRIINLNDLLLNLDKMLCRLIGEDIELKFTIVPDLGKVGGDSGQLEQMLVNLVVNARDAMPHGGELFVEATNVTLGLEDVRLRTGVAPGEYVLIVVRDTGCGMPEEVKTHCFEPFFTTKEAGKGTGLGLATSYGIVKQHGGHIEVESEPGQGTIFRIYLPRVETLQDNLYVQDNAGNLLQGKETVLLVEDEPAVRTTMVRALQACGYTMLEAATGGEALHLVQQHGRKPIHILVTDVVMPKMSGHELAERLVALHPETKVLYVSGYPEEFITSYGIMIQDTTFLQKPFTSADLVRKVREMLDQENHSPSVRSDSTEVGPPHSRDGGGPHRSCLDI